MALFHFIKQKNIWIPLNFRTEKFCRSTRVKFGIPDSTELRTKQIWNSDWLFDNLVIMKSYDAYTI